MGKLINPLWYLAAFAIALGSWMAGTVVAAGAWEPVRQATVVQAGPTIDAAGDSVAVFTDLEQPDRDIRCHLNGPEKQSTEVRPAKIDILVDTEGTPWTLLGMVDKGRDGAALVCTPIDKAVDDAEYGFAVIDGFDSRANTANGIMILGSVAGLGLAGWTFINRRRQRKEGTP